MWFSKQQQQTVPQARTATVADNSRHDKLLPCVLSLTATIEDCLT
jgi:hypothetical protein